MTPRDTRSGGVMEDMLSHSLRKGGYEYEDQVLIGQRFGGGRHIVDKVAKKDGKHWIVSCKWQGVGGTAEQKVPFEVICLLDAVRKSEGLYEKAYLVLGGNGWKLREWYCNDGLLEFIDYNPYVRIMKLEDFVHLANTGNL